MNKLTNHQFFNKKKKLKSLFCIFVLISTFFLISGSQLVHAEENNAETFAPILYFEGLETCYPIDAQFHIDNSELYVHDGNTATLVDDSPTATELAAITDQNYFLDNANGAVRDSASIISSYQQQKNNYETIVYYREQTQPGRTILQYWFFYAYNNGDLNVHEGDWEMIQLIIESNNPTMVMYSQHHSGQQTSWNNVETSNSHPQVYVARGSHANYFRSFSGKLGVASDTVSNNGVVLTPEDYTLVELSDQEWLNFAGRWGEMQNIEDTVLGFSGPFGPAFRENGQMWNNPLGWGDRLPQLNTALLPVEFLLYHFVTIFALITVVSIGLLVFKLYRRHQAHGLGPRLLSSLYIDGINRHSIGNLVFFAGIILALVGLVLPWYAVSAQVTVNEYTTEGFVDFLRIDGLQGVQITYPGADGPIALGSFILPFAVLIGIGLLISLFKAVGIQQSKLLGKVYLWRGIGLMIPFIILLGVIFSIGSIIPSMVPDDAGGEEIMGLFSSLSQNPIGGSESIPLTENGMTGSIDLVWGLGQGGMLLLVSGFLLIVAAGLLISAQKTFY